MTLEHAQVPYLTLPTLDMANTAALPSLHCHTLPCPVLPCPCGAGQGPVLPGLIPRCPLHGRHALTATLPYPALACTAL